jgi:hypothetical protein
MRTLFGIVIGIALTIGVAFVHDNNVVPDPANPRLQDRQIVNWDVFSAVARDLQDALGRAFHSLTGK